MLARLLAGFWAIGFTFCFSALALGQTAAMRPGAALPSFSADASLHHVMFLDPDLGWACGDRGTVLATMNGGAKWDVIATGHEGSLRHVHFKSAKEGIAIGGRSIGLAGKSEAVILETIDGGQTWKRVIHDLPAIHAAGWFDANNGWAVGDRSEKYPAGLFRTSDGGASWTGMTGETPGPWLCAAFPSPSEGIVAGYESIAANATPKGLTPIDMTASRAGAIRAAALLEHGQMILAGDRGAVWRVRRGRPPQRLRVLEESVIQHLAGFEKDQMNEHGKHSGGLQTAGMEVDFLCAASQGQTVWLAGAPGTTLYRSTDAGATWTGAATGQDMAIRGMHFLDAERGFAVGDLGLVLATRDGGQSWRVQRRAAEFGAYLAVFGEASQTPWELIARISAQDGHHGQVICVASRHSTLGAMNAADSDMISRAATRLGATAGKTLPDYLIAEGEQLSIAELERIWMSGDQSARMRLEADLIREIRTWRPEVIFTELPPSHDGDAIRQLTSQAVLSAVADAARADQGGGGALSPWQVKRVYGVQPRRRGFKTVDSGQLATRLGRSIQEAAWPARRECGAGESLAPELFGLQLLLDHTDNDPARSDLFSGIRIEMGGPRRRVLAEPPGSNVETTARRATRHHEVVKLLREAHEVLKPAEIESMRIVKALDGLDSDFSAQALFELATIASTRGNRAEAIEALQDLSKELPDHPLAEEAKRRSFVLASSAERLWRDQQTPTPVFAMESAKAKEAISTLSQPSTEAPSTEGAMPAATTLNGGVSQEVIALLSPHAEGDRQSQFMAAALQRSSSDPALAYDFYRAFAKDFPDDWLASCAEAEIWLLQRRKQAPKRVTVCASVTQRPYLDGELTEAMWSEGAMELKADRSTATGAKCWIARDDKFLYFAVRCPTNAAPAAIGKNRRDVVDERADRVELLLDVDRDWGTFFRLAVSESGATIDESAGDLTWNPKWYAAVRREAEAWTAECAIPLAELSPYAPEKGEAWAVGIQRSAPGRPLASWTQPAAKKGMAAGFGLLLFEE